MTGYTSHRGTGPIHHPHHAPTKEGDHSTDMGRASDLGPFPAPTSLSLERGNGKAHPAWKIRKQHFLSLPLVPWLRPTHTPGPPRHKRHSMEVMGPHPLSMSKVHVQVQVMEDVLVQATRLEAKDIGADPQTPRQDHSLGALTRWTQRGHYESPFSMS